MLMKLVAKKKKSKVCRLFFIWQHDRVLWIFSLVGLHLLFSLKGPQREKYVNFYASYPLKNKKLQGAEHGLWTVSKQICELTIVQDVTLQWFM